MAQLIHMRQRIKAVETIKKITHAMRLVAMSTHSRLRIKKSHLEAYKKTFQTLWTQVKKAVKAKEDTQELKLNSLSQLIILVSSQKGLCGAFNTHLFKYFQKKHLLSSSDHFITVGKYASDYLKQEQATIFATYNDFNSNNFVSIAQAITNIIIQSPENYQTVTIYSNYPKNFFVQKPQKTSLLPLKDISLEQSADLDTIPSEEYLFEQDPAILNIHIQQLMLSITVQELLFESLLAEQAARFISMDNSTRNADNLLNTMKLEYNKTRQAAITRELTELASGY